MKKEAGQGTQGRCKATANHLLRALELDKVPRDEHLYRQEAGMREGHTSRTVPKEDGSASGF